MKTKRTATADSDAGSYDVPEDDFEAFDDSDDEEKTKAAIKMQVRQCGEEFFFWCKSGCPNGYVGEII